MKQIVLGRRNDRLKIPFFFLLVFLTISAGFPGCKKSNDTTPPPVKTDTIPVPVTISFSPTQGMPGDSVTISGTVFNNLKNVSFNGTIAAIIGHTDSTKLIVTVPEGATTGKVDVSFTSGVSIVSKDSFTVNYPLSAKATVIRLAAIPGYPTNGASGERMIYAENALYISGPGTNQNAVFKLDLTTLAVSKYFSLPTQPEATALATYGGDAGFMITSGEYGSQLFTYRYGNLTASNAPANGFFSLVFSGDRFYGSDFDNRIYSVNVGTAGGNSESFSYDTVINSQLNGIPAEASTMLAAGGDGTIYAFANQALWKVNNDKSLGLVAGKAGSAGYKDGASTTALFQDGGYARGNAITVNGAGNILVCDYGSGCIRSVDNSGNVTTIVGNTKINSGVTPGRGDQMRFSFDSFDIATDADGSTIYVLAVDDQADSEHRNAVYKVTFTK